MNLNGQTGNINSISDTEVLKMFPNYTKGEKLQEYMNIVDQVYKWLVTQNTYLEETLFYAYYE